MGKAKLITINGESKSIRQWAKHSGIPYRSLVYRISAGWEISQALTCQPVIGRNQSTDKPKKPKCEVDKARAEASRRWREKHPEKNRQSQIKQDSKPERKKRKNAAAKIRMSTDEYKQRRKSYLSRPDVAERIREREKSESRREYQRAWRKLPHALAYGRRFKQSQLKTPFGILNNRMRSAIRRGIKRGTSIRLWEVLGYTAQDLKRHIERQFHQGMTWDNANEWHIDHIIPLSSFTYSSINDDEFISAWSLPNLRPLWQKDNLTKSAKIVTLL